MRFNHIFLRHFMTDDISEPGYPSDEHAHTYKFYKFLEKYKSPVDPDYNIPHGFELNVTPKITYNEVELRPIMKKDHLNVIWVPMHYPIWRWFNEYYPEAFHDLEVLADPNSEYPTAVVWDYNNETLLPGNFTNNETQLPILKDKDYSQFYCSTLAWQRQNVQDTIGFKDIIQNYSALGGLILFEMYQNQLSDPGQHLYFEGGISTKVKTIPPIRYLCPSNVFRPNRAMCIVKMHQKGMLDNTEWNMNQMDSWFEMDRFHDSQPFGSYVDEYFKLFGITERVMSYPWNKTFNMDRVMQGRGDYSMSFKSSYDTFPASLVDKTYLYIVQETFTHYPTEQPINPTKPVHVGDWSEKILKGFYYGMPMFLNARQGTGKIMEELGFDMLTDYSKHDYDSEPDSVVRIDKMLDSAIEFPEPNQDIIDRLQHNNRLVRNKEFWWNSQSLLVEKLLDNHS